MRRPVVLAALAFALGIGAEFYMDLQRSVLAAGIIAAVFGLLFFALSGASPGRFPKLCVAGYRRAGGKYKKLFGRHGEPDGKSGRVVLAFLAMLCFFAGAASLQIHNAKADYFREHIGESISFCGTICSAEKKDEEYYKLTLKKDTGEKILVSLYGDYKDISGGEALKNYGDLVGRAAVITAEPELAAARRNPNCFDYRRYLMTKGIGSICTVKPAAARVFGVGEDPRAAAESPKAAKSGKETKKLTTALTTSIESKKCKILNIISVERAAFIEKLISKTDADTAGLVIGMVLGDKNELADDTYELFQKNGTAHILAVSGIHIGILYACVYTLLGKRKSLAVGLLSLAVLLCYAAFAMWAPSVMRAVSMIALHIVAQLLHKRYDMLCAGAFCALVMLIKNPMSLFDLGFQLSYMAIFVLAVVLPLAQYAAQRALSRPYELKNRNKGAVARLAENTILLFLPAFVIQLGMIPITAYTFNYFSLAAFFINVPVIYLAGFTVPLGILLAPLLKFAEGSLLTGVAATAEELLCGLLIRANSLVFSPGLSYSYVTSPPLWALFCYYALLFFLTSESAVILWRRGGGKDGRRGGRAPVEEGRGAVGAPRRCSRLGAAALAAALAGCTAAAVVSGAGEIEVWKAGRGLSAACESSAAVASEKRSPGEAALTFVDVGQGDCLHIRTPSGKNILVDGGGSANYDVGKKTLLPYLLKNGVKKLDLVFVTHRHTDHYAGICSLAHELEIEKLAFYEANAVSAAEITEETGMDAADILWLSAGKSVDFGDGVSVEVVSPPRREREEYERLVSEDADENAISMVLRVNYQGLSVLMTGDVDIEGEKELLDRGCDLDADILKVAHHGSKYSSSQEFLAAVSPELAVVQVGKNTFGHPTEEALSRLSETGAAIYRNDLQGAICVFAGEDGFEIGTMLSGEDN